MLILLIIFIINIIKLTFEVQYYGSIELMTKQTRFSRLRLAITINIHILLGAQLFTGGPGPLGPLASYVPIR